MSLERRITDFAAGATARLGRSPRTLDDLTHDEQFRLYDLLTEVGSSRDLSLRSAMARDFGSLLAGNTRGSAPAPVQRRAAQDPRAEERRRVEQRQRERLESMLEAVRRDAGLPSKRASSPFAIEAAADPDIWAAVLRVERLFDIPTAGTRLQRYERIAEHLANASERSHEGGAQAEQYRRLRARCEPLIEAEKRFVERRRESAQARSSLQRQAAAVLTASKRVA